MLLSSTSSQMLTVIRQEDVSVVFCRGKTQCVGNVHNVSSTRVAEFDLLTENLDSGCLTCAYSL